MYSFPCNEPAPCPRRGGNLQFLCENPCACKLRQRGGPGAKAPRARFVIGGAANFPDTNDIESAISAINENIPSLAAAAENFVAAEGFDYPVKIVLDEEHYPTRNYESLSFPKGRYLSLRVMMGEAEGENWWCVLFPPLCLSAASKKQDDTFISVGLTEEQYKIITDTDKTTYNVRFKILETIEEAFG